MNTSASQGDQPTHAGGIVWRATGTGPEYLIVTAKKRSDQWLFPKGHIEKGESPEAAARREVAEETGVDADVLAEVGTTEFDTPSERVRVRFFLMRFVGSTQPDERRQVRWVDYETAHRMLSFDDTRELLERAETLRG